jgi:hypothetical protein
MKFRAWRPGALALTFLALPLGAKEKLRYMEKLDRGIIAVGMVTLMRDPQYRLAIAWQNVAYNQPPHPGFYLDEAAPLPKKPVIRFTRD